MDKNRLINFMARVMEESGFKVYRNFQTSRHIIDIYGVLPTVLGDIGVVVACKNYDDRWEVGLDVLKEMEMVAKTLKASKIVVVSTSYFTNSAINYASRRNIKTIDKDGLMVLAKKFSAQKSEYGGVEVYEESDESDTSGVTEIYKPSSKTSSSFPKTSSTSSGFFSRGRGTLNRAKNSGTLSKSLSLPKSPGLKPILTNTVSLIIIVYLLSSLITYFLGTNAATSGIYKILVAAALSYGLVLASDRDLNTILTKGTIVFFVVLVIYVLVIVFL